MPSSLSPIQIPAEALELRFVSAAVLSLPAHNLRLLRWRICAGRSVRGRTGRIAGWREVAVDGGAGTNGPNSSEI